MTEPGKPLVPPEWPASIVRWFAPGTVILFGSRARGEAGPGSDLDLLVVVRDDTAPERVAWCAPYAARLSPIRRYPSHA